MATTKYLKLGDKAQSFYDASTKTQVAKGEVIEFTPERQNSKRIQRAVKAGHLDWTEAPTTKTLPKELEVNEPEEIDWYTREELENMKLSQLKKIASENDLEFGGKITKEELISMILS